MTFRSKEQPLCRCCGRAIKKRTHAVYVRDDSKRLEHQAGVFSRYLYLSRDKFPETKTDCQKLVNEQVVSVTYFHDRTISWFGTWDGESYIDEYFCTGECAKKWGYLMAEAFPDKVSGAYNAAVAKRTKEKV